ncbi:hypothetical protein N7517_008589 [Penicillium concentricum]|uniref:Rhodopsin domain-containing protein n=1 Tax=Penicillium concentricum TaxID=293559 RepID=A0A9W9RSP1_9EURO|nr:uncharacterized protein N7517_008589 [Penicillium concentricum]KAJ5365703.1 hypothetical protein N7517_008589 [Penicillium concentricum]
MLCMQQTILYIFLSYGCGLPSSQASPGVMQHITQWLFIEEVFYMFVHFTLKQAFLMFYLRLSPKRSFQLAVYGTMVMCTLFLVVEWLLAFLQARPLTAMFHPEAYPNAKYLSQYVVQMVPTALNAISDIIILILPIPTVLNLQMSTRRKVAVLGIICFGLLSVVTALCRFVVQKQLITDPDTSYVMGRMVIVAGIEIQIAVIAVNLPALRSLFTKLVGSSHDPTSYDQRGAHKLSSLKGGSKKSLKEHLVEPHNSHDGFGATLTGSEEELMRQQGVDSSKNIRVVTNVGITSHKAAGDNFEVNIGFPAATNRSHIHP